MADKVLIQHTVHWDMTVISDKKIPNVPVDHFKDLHRVGQISKLKLCISLTKLGWYRFNRSESWCLFMPTFGMCV